ncbi:hypothetical protein ABID12_000959 [Martelella mangrovi]|uniref:Uncharacterized protein n=1 Tax=Martelella mangrovi TaxID=1397477 RepID=A0ABV2I977_9HYPH
MSFEQVYITIPLILLVPALGMLGFQLWRARHNH